MHINPRIFKGPIAVREATMPYIQSAVHTFEPSYARHPKQSFIGGTYQPLAGENMTDTHSRFKARHRAELYTQKAPLRTKTVHRSLYIPTEEPSPVTCDTDTLAITDEQRVPPLPKESLPSNDGYTSQAVTHTLQTALTAAGHGLRRAVRTVANATRTTAHAIHTGASTIRETWHTFTRFKAVQFIIKFFQSVHALWKRRMKFSYAFYTAVFFLLTSAEVIFLQWGMYSEPKYTKGSKVSETTKILQSVSGKTTQFICQMWLENKYNFLLNLFALAIIYLIFIFITNRFWVATLIFGLLFTTYGAANSIKMKLRNEPIIPADLSFITSGNSESLLSFIPKESQQFVEGTINIAIWLACLCVLFFIIDGRRQFIPCSWRHPFSNPGIFVGSLTRIFATIACIALICSYSFNLSAPGSWAFTFAGQLGYTPSLRPMGQRLLFLALPKQR